MRDKQVKTDLHHRGEPHTEIEDDKNIEGEKLWLSLEQSKDDQEFLVLASEARKSGKINLLALDKQNSLIHRLVARFNRRVTKEGAHPFHTAIEEVTDLLMPNIRQSDQPDIIDRYMELMPEFYQLYPETTGELTNVLDQNAQVVDPKIYLKTQAIILQQPGLSVMAKQGALAGLAYQATYGLLPFLKEQIDHTSEMPVDEASQFLTLLQATAQYGEGWDFSEESSGQIDQMIEQFASESTSVLLKRKAQMLLQDSYLHFQEEEQANGTAQIEIENVSRDRIGILPAAAGYLGVYNRVGIFQGFLLEGSLKYKRSDLIDPSSFSVLRITSKMDEETRQRRLQAQRDYASLLDKPLIEGIEQDYGFSLRDLTLREQIWFVAALRDLTPEHEKNVQEFTQTFGLDGARTFLAVESADNWRDEILKIADQLDPEIAQNLFARFSEVAQLAQSQIAQVIRPLFHEDVDVHLDEAQVEQSLLSRAQNLLKRAADPDTDPEQINRLLAKQTADVILFATIFHTLFKGEQHPDIKIFKDMEFGRFSGEDISDQQREEMFEMAKENWKELPELASFVMTGARKALDNPTEKQQYFALQKGQKIQTYFCLEERDSLESGALYGRSFNVAPELRGSAVGESFLHTVLDEQAKEHIIYCDVFPEVLAGTAYVEKFGFVIIGIEEIELNNGKTAKRFLLRRDDQNNGTYLARHEDVQQEDLEKMRGVRVERFDMRTQKQEMMSKMDDATRKGNVITRYWYDKNDSNIRWHVFSQTRGCSTGGFGKNERCSSGTV